MSGYIFLRGCIQQVRSDVITHELMATCPHTCSAQPLHTLFRTCFDLRFFFERSGPWPRSESANDSYDKTAPHNYVLKPFLSSKLGTDSNPRAKTDIDQFMAYRLLFLVLLLLLPLHSAAASSLLARTEAFGFGSECSTHHTVQHE